MELHWSLWPWNSLRFRIWATWFSRENVKTWRLNEPYERYFWDLVFNASKASFLEVLLLSCRQLGQRPDQLRPRSSFAVNPPAGSLIHSANLCDMSEVKFVTSSFLASRTQAVRRKHIYRYSLIWLVSPNSPTPDCPTFALALNHFQLFQPKKKQASIHPVLCASMHDSKSEFKTQTIPSTNQPYLIADRNKK